MTRPRTDREILRNPDEAGDEVGEELLSTEVGIQTAGGDGTGLAVFIVTGRRSEEHWQPSNMWQVGKGRKPQKRV